MSFRGLFVLAGLLLLQACGGTPAIYYQDLKTALTSPSDVALSVSEISESSYDLLYVRIDDQPRVAMALAYLEHGQHKWVSADGVVFVLEQGRLVRTTGLSSNLQFITNRKADPLRTRLEAPHQPYWLRLVDWTDASGYALESRFIEQESETLVLFERDVTTRVMQEQVTVVDTRQSYRNLFWFDVATGMLIQSEQHLTPLGPVIQFVHISPLVRQWQQEGSSE